MYTGSLDIVPNFYDKYPEYWTDGRKNIGIYGNHYLPGRYFSRRDINFISSINSELLGDIIENVIQLFKISPTETNTNIYGETVAEIGKTYYPATDLTALIQLEDITSETNDGFGIDRSQNIVFKFFERDCISTNVFPEIGDIILFNERYYEIDNVVQEQFLGGQPDKSLSIICHTHYTKLSNLNIIERQT